MKDILNLCRKHFLLAVASCSFIFVSCKNEVDGRITIDDRIPQQVVNVKSESGPGEVTFSWTIPDTVANPSFMYTKIEYLDSKGEKQYRLISKYRAVDNVSTETIRGFADVEEKTFSFYTCTVRGYHGESVDVKVAPGTPAFIELVKTVTLTPDLGGILVNWDNPYDSPVNLVIDYYATADNSKSGRTLVEVEGRGKGSEFVSLVYGNNQIISGEECVVNVIGQDEALNESEPQKFTITPKKAVKLDRTGWSFPGYVNNSNDGTIGYSSQETQGEGADPKGRVMAMLDGDPSTFWHASWKVATDYPHWFIVDLGKDFTISTVELLRRQDSNNGPKCQKGHKIYTCSDANASDKTNPESWTWIDHGSFDFDVNSAAPQSYRLSSNPTARYIKVYFGTEHKGVGNQATMAEFNVYGVE